VAVTVAVGVNVAVGVDVGVNVAVAVGVAVEVAVAVAVGVGVGLDAVYWIASTGGSMLSRVSNRFAVRSTDSSPRTSQPKLLDGLFTHDCTSATICAELHVYGPTGPTDWLALTVGEKSPPCMFQKIVSKKRCRHVASLLVAGAPWPSCAFALDVPSPQSASTLCNSIVRAVVSVVLDICMLRLTLVMVEPGGMLAAMLKASTPRRMKPISVFPAKK
jgi:hypothetical protein